MRTSGSGGRDGLMMAVPVAILVVFGVYTGGGLSHILHVVEVAMWTVFDGVRQLFM
jgi:hypothetical protein